jgi:hypothetical protein
MTKLFFSRILRQILHLSPKTLQEILTKSELWSKSLLVSTVSTFIHFLVHIHVHVTLLDRYVSPGAAGAGVAGRRRSGCRGSRRCKAVCTGFYSVWVMYVRCAFATNASEKILIAIPENSKSIEAISRPFNPHQL